MSEMAVYRAARPMTRLTPGAGGIVAAAAPVGALVCGWLIAAGHQDLVIACFAAVAALVIARYWPGPVVGAVVWGWLIAAGHQDLVIACFAAAAALVIARYWPGPFVALMVLVIMNGVPVVDLSTRIVGSFGIQDRAGDRK